MPLTDTSIRHTKPDSKPKRLFDGGGLYLEVAPSGSRYWRIKYRFAGKENRLSLGVYPEVTLKEARSRRAEFRRLLAVGTNPSAARKAAKVAVVTSAGNTFEAVAREWFQKNLSKWKPSHSRTILQRFELYAFPAFGSQPIADVMSAQLLGLLRQLEARGVRETAHRVLQLCGQVFRYAIATSRLASDPTPALRGALGV